MHSVDNEQFVATKSLNCPAVLAAFGSPPKPVWAKYRRSSWPRTAFCGIHYAFKPCRPAVARKASGHQKRSTVETKKENLTSTALFNTFKHKSHCEDVYLPESYT